MLRLQKIFIKNYKGVYHPQTIDFDGSQITILDGPNGFGKTTIFDAIELCLRGLIERTVQYGNVTKKNQNHKKAFYQNTAGEDVILKVWILDDQTKVNHVIIKFLSKDHDGKVDGSRAFRPDMWGILETYYTTDVALFETVEKITSLEKIDQAYIDKLFFDSTSLSLESLYPLFNYLQQEENIYFLKKDEEQKKNELNFLFQTQPEIDNLDQLDAFLKNVRINIGDIEGKIKELGEASNGDIKAEFKENFPGKNYSLDKISPFKDTPSEVLTLSYDKILNELENIVTFLESFDTVEFKRSKYKDSLATVFNSDKYLYSYLLQHFFDPLELADIGKRKVNSDSLKENIIQIQKFNFNESIIERLGFDKSFISDLNNLLSQRLTTQSDIGEIGKIIADLIESRQAVIDNFNKLNEKEKQDPNCPLCNTEWGNIELLSSAILEKTNLLRQFNETKLRVVEDLNNKIKTEYISAVEEKTSEFQSLPENYFVDLFYQKVHDNAGNKETIARFKKLLEDNGVDLNSYILKDQISFEDLERQKITLKEELTKLHSKIFISDEKIANKSLYKDLFDEKEEDFKKFNLGDLTEKRNYLRQEYQNAKLTSLNVLNNRLTWFKQIEPKVLKLYNSLDRAIKKYKVDMVEKIKIPFYILSGKILQNYQQGHGIFIDMQEATNRVRFLTDSDSDHDIIHHLSSGQLAVVSIAFCLALNKVYNAQNKFKFIAIDDPVQTMDDINVHSFIELLRHDFKDFQLIISTHEDHVANYLNYKFSKFGIASDRKKVQEIFYSSQT